MDNKTKALQKLEEMNVPYKIINHKAAYHVGDLDGIEFEHKDDVVKNLFLRDAKGKRHFLVVLEKNKKADLKSIRQQLDCSALSFASERRLDKYLKLTKGSVSPLGIINDTQSDVEVVFDKDLVDKDVLGVHPNDNTATILISFKDLEKIIRANGNKIYYVEI